MTKPKKLKPADGKKSERKTFSLPTSGPLYDDMDDIVVGSATGDAFQPPVPEAVQQQALSPQQLQALESMLGTDRLVGRSLRTIAVTILFFSVAGAASGALLALLIPNFFRFAADAIDRIDFRVWEVGLGYGTLIGAGTGLIVGCVAVLAAALYQTRMIKRLSN